MEEQRRLGTVVTPGGAISRGALEKGYGGIVAAYMMSLFNERCNGRGGGGGHILCLQEPARLTIPGCLDPQDNNVSTQGT